MEYKDWTKKWDDALNLDVLICVFLNSCYGFHNKNDVFETFKLFVSINVEGLTLI